MNTDVLEHIEWCRTKSDISCIVKTGFKFSVTPIAGKTDFALSIVRPAMAGCRIDCLAETFETEADAIARAELLISLERNL
jgi:hypothetical protein